MSVFPAEAQIVPDAEPVVPAAKDDLADLWSSWNRLVAEFGFGRMFRHLTVSRSGWGFYGVDVVSTLKATPFAKGGLKVLEPLSDDRLALLGDLAALNARRNEALWRMAALFYVTVPVGIFLAFLQGAPKLLQAFLAFTAVGLAPAVVVATLGLLYYFANNWRAHQIEAVIGLARIERRARARSLLQEPLA